MLLLRRLLLIAITLASTTTVMASSSTKEEGTTTSDVNPHIITIVGSGVTQSLPASYAQSFPRWQVDSSKKKAAAVVTKQSTSSINLQLDEQHQDSRPKQVRPTIEFLIKKGIPTYVMAGLELEGRGALPLARQWTTFDLLAIEPNFRIELFVNNKVLVHQGNNKEIQLALEVLATVLAELPTTTTTDDSELLLGDGYHILSIPLSKWYTVPKSPSFRLTCLATAEPDAVPLLTISQELLELTGSSILEMSVGGSSETINTNEL